MLEATVSSFCAKNNDFFVSPSGKLNYCFKFLVYCLTVAFFDILRILTRSQSYETITSEFYEQSGEFLRAFQKSNPMKLFQQNSS